MSQTYAVVDIETTGTDVSYDKVIQVGCVLIEDGKVVGRYATDINPASGFDKHIQTLTGLTPSRLRKAPYFEEIASSLRSFLDGSIFVAHNIGFDYHFLNEAFKKVGEEPLDMPGIDTVTLTQVLFPTEISFKLKDLAESFGFLHENPHQADSDAKVTSDLFLKLEKKLYSIPLTTLKGMIPYLFAFPYETGNWIYEIYEKRLKESEKNYPDLLFHKDLAFRMPKYFLKEEDKLKKFKNYPFKNQGKIPFFPDDFQYRKIQGKMMNKVYRFFNGNEETTLFLEAPFGMGKTFGYLFPISFLLQKEKKVIIATSTLVLQQQLLEETNAFSKKLPFSMEAVLLKSGRHFLSLENFWKSLQKIETSKRIALYKMMILVWLLETSTGDFSELNLIGKDEEYFYQISSVTKEKERGGFEDFEYYRLLKKKAQEAQIIITNHSYLMEPSSFKEKIFKETPYLILDEAHQLPSFIRHKSQKNFSLSRLRKMISYDSNRENPFGLYAFFTPYLHSFDKLVGYFKKRVKEEPFYFNGETFLTLPEKIKVAFDDLENLKNEFGIFLKELDDKNNFFYLQLEEFYQALKTFLTIDSRHISWIEKEKNDVIFQNGLIDSLDLESETWYTNFEKILFVGAAFYYGKENLLQQELGINDSPSVRLKSPYSYEKQLNLYYIKGEEIDEGQEEKNLVETVKQVIKEIDKPVLVLFSSQKALKNVYYKLQETALLNNRELLAQDVNGTKEKILKRFKLGEKSILLGNMAFWEGIDLPKDSLEILFISKLPFENPDWPITKIIQRHLEEQGFDPFEKYMLPHCILKLNQALGRLIRSEEDRGIAFIFDQRIVHSGYSHKIQRNLIPGIKVQKGEVKDASKIIRQSLQL